MRRTAALVAALLVAASPTNGVAAQDSTVEPVVIFTCATITGDPPGGTWDPDSLQDAVATGEAAFDSFIPPEDCGGSDEPPADGSGTGDPAPSGTDADASAEPPLPIEIREAAMSKLGDSVTYVVIVENPNAADWAVAMPFRVDVLNKKGKRVGFVYDRLFLLPGQTGALSGIIAGAKGAKQLDVIPADHVTHYVSDFPADADVQLTGVETKVADFLGTTTGTIAGVPADVLGVVLISVHRNKKSKLIATGSAYLQGSPEDGTMFEISSFVDGKVAETETYYQIIR